MNAAAAPPPDPLETATLAYQNARDAEARARQRAARARQAVDDAHQASEELRKVLAEVIATEASRGRGNAEIRRITGYTRQRVQQICRDAGVTPTE